MHAVITAALPVFALILVGWLAARRRLLGATASDVLNRFVVYLSLPALLFRAMSQVTWEQLAHPGYVLSFLGGIAAAFAVALIAHRGKHTALTDISIEALSNSYANVGFMGIPLCLVLFGQQSLAPAVVATLMTACVLFGVSIALIEADQRHGQHLGKTAAKVGAALIRNPLLVSPVLGFAWAVTGLPLPESMDRFMVLLGNAASPCALIAIGLFLAQTEAGGNGVVVARVVAAKLLVQPAVTAALAFGVFTMPPVWSWTAVLLSALPIGTGPFILAQLYGRDARVASRTILLSTLASVLTISALVAWIEQLGVR
ncbi:transporter [Bordetella sp. H567]|uniref:AEC family transporter n=1 Tax=Bordetella sp. H567 TaxID=1697043 RepID=UPI00081CEEDC|nr:AEC family transporter [Bordetella sp. H567]AOB33778.1 transporter [Bordetella sp. H567]